MKRYYCDLCHEQMAYDDKPVSNTEGRAQTLLIQRKGEPSLTITLQVEVKAQTLHPGIDNTPSWQQRVSPPKTVTKHADLCGPCRWALLEHLRGGHPRPLDTAIAAIGGTELKWDTDAG